MRDYHTLEVATQARELAVAIYEVTGAFPPPERYGLAAQMRRAAISIPSNIAEGTGRSGDREFLRFLYIALGSATELAIQLEVASALRLIDAARYGSLADRTNHVQRMLNRLTASVRRKLGRPAPTARDT